MKARKKKMEPMNESQLNTRKVASWLTPTRAMTMPVAMLTEPSFTIWRTLAPAVVKLKWRKLGARRAPWWT